jgi:hypothetical protein
MREVAGSTPGLAYTMQYMQLATPVCGQNEGEPAWN